MRHLSYAALSLLLFSGCTQSRYNPYGRNAYPSSARTTANGQERYRVCHKDKNELTLPSSAVDAHLRHGDRFGDCGRRGRDDDNGRGNNRGNGRGRGNN